LGEREVEKEKFKPAKTISLEEDANNPVIPGSN
jgi:hypothetical protein